MLRRRSRAALLEDFWTDVDGSGKQMKTVTLSVSSREDIKRRVVAAFDGKALGAHLSFATPELLWGVLTERRWSLLRLMAGQGPMSIREVARRAGRDIKGVHGDVRALVTAGVVEEDEKGVVFPYDAVHVDFTLKAA